LRGDWTLLSQIALKESDREVHKYKGAYTWYSASS